MDNWRLVWRQGIAPVLNVLELAALERALLTDDPALQQGATVQCNWRIVAACALTYGAWKTEGLKTGSSVCDAFNCICFEADMRLDPCNSVCEFLHWFDETPRAEMRAAMLPEVSRELARRAVTMERSGPSPRVAAPAAP
jgi:hypothetical protein